MSGVVEGAKKVGEAVADVASMPFTGVPNPLQLVQMGKGVYKGAKGIAQKGLGKGIGEGTRAAYGPGVSQIAAQGSGAVGGILGEKEVPSVVADDPAERARKDREERARVRRQAEIDILTDRPGRGGTILTDSYKYKV